MDLAKFVNKKKANETGHKHVGYHELRSPRREDFRCLTCLLPLDFLPGPLRHQYHHQLAQQQQSQLPSVAGRVPGLGGCCGPRLRRRRRGNGRDCRGRGARRDAAGAAARGRNLPSLPAVGDVGPARGHRSRGGRQSPQPVGVTPARYAKNLRMQVKHIYVFSISSVAVLIACMMLSVSSHF